MDVNAQRVPALRRSGTRSVPAPAYDGEYFTPTLRLAMCTPWRQAQGGSCSRAKFFYIYIYEVITWEKEKMGPRLHYSCSRARAQGVVLGLHTHSEKSVPKYTYYINLRQRIRLRICAFCSIKGRNLPEEILKKSVP